jgi:serine/threonine-protein kinase
MSADRTCPDCGAVLPADAPRGLCPACLMGAALSRISATGARSWPELTVAFEPSGRSAPGAAGSLAALAESLGGVPRVLLRDTEGGSGVDPVVQPTSAEMPDMADRWAHLQFLGEIARGGMGAILKGRDVGLGRDLAVKVLLEKHREEPALVRRFIEEAQIAGQLQHPGIVPVYELGAFADRRPYFTMKLVKGRTLAAVLAGRGDPAEDQMGLLAALLQIGQTVAFAHARGVIHRDLKPSNVMLGNFGEVQVMDWGLAKVLPRGCAADDVVAGPAEDREAVITTARSDSDPDLSQAGSVLGTPAYMAPEQARGEIEAVDERADVFALGSILCEVLTGQPAFTGRGSVEIHRKATLGDLADAFSRLDGSGADAELIGLARDCLARERDDRPRDASAFVERLGGHLTSIDQRLRAAELERAAEAARAEEARARIAVERSRRRRTVAMAAALLAMTTLGGLSFIYLLQQRQARLAAADRVLGEATTLVAQARSRPDDPARWQVALAAARQVDAAGLPAEAAGRLEALVHDARAGAAAAEAGQDLLGRLVDIRSAEADDRDGSATDAAYAGAFRAAGCDVDALGPEAAGVRIRSRPGPVALAMAAALDDWATLRRLARPKDEVAWRRLSAAARVADPDPRRDELRTLWQRPDRRSQLGSLRALAGQADVATWPVQSLNLLALTVAEAGDVDAAAALLRRAVARHAGDVWINYNLAKLLNRTQPPHPDEAIRYYTAARALRPETAHALAHALDDRGDSDEAIAVFRDLGRLRPAGSQHFICLGTMLQSRGRTGEARAVLDEAITSSRAAIRLEPDVAEVHRLLGAALREQGQLEEAAAEFREAIRLQPDLANARVNLGWILQGQGQLDAAVAEYRAAMRLQPNDVFAPTRLGNLSAQAGRWDEALGALARSVELAPNDHYLSLQTAVLYLQAGDDAGYRRHCRALLDRFGRTANPVIAERVAKACFLGIRPVDDGGRASRLAAVAVTAVPAHRYIAWFRLARGLAEYRVGRPLRAIDWLDQSRTAGGHLAIQANLVLAMAEQRVGHGDRARRLLADATNSLRSRGIKGFDEGQSWHDWLTCDLLRREAEATIFYDPIFPADPFAPSASVSRPAEPATFAASHSGDRGRLALAVFVPHRGRARLKCVPGIGPVR